MAGFGLLAWLALDAVGAALVEVYQVRGHLDLDPEAWVARAALPLFAAVAAGGLCRVGAMISRRGAASRRG